MSRLLTLVLVLGAGAAIAKPRIAVMPFEGPKASKVKTQVSKMLCSKFTCVKPSKHNKKAASVDAVVTGSISGQELELKVYTDPDSDPVTRTLALSKGKLSKKAAPEMSSAVKEAIKSADADDDDDSDDSGGGSTTAAP